MPISWRADLSVKELVPVKLLLFLQAAGDMALYPFFTLHMKSLGITLTEIGIQFAVTPVATLIATPLVGLLADRMGNFKVMLAATLVLCAIMANFILMVPKISQMSECELTRESVQLTCPGDGESEDRFFMSVPECFQRNETLFNRTLASLDNVTVGSASLINNSKALNFLIFSDCYVDCFPKVSSRVRKYCLKEKVGHDESCFSFAPDADQESSSSPGSRGHRFTIGLTVAAADLASVGSVVNGSKTRTIAAQFYEVVSDYKFYQKLTCRSIGCEIRCPVKATTRLGSGHTQRRVDDPASRKFTFWSYLILRISLIVVIATEMSLLKAAILTLVDKWDSEYGFQRLWSSIAVCIVPPITGVVMDRLKASGDPDAFYPCFYVYSGFKVFMAAVALVVDMNAKTPSLQIWKRLGELVRNREATVLLVFVTIIGSTWGFIETFIVWYLQELQASRTLIGLSFTISALSGIPFTIGAGWLERRFGHVPILVVGLAAYALRLLGYSFSTSAYHILALETLEGITTSLVIVTITTYSTVLSTHELVATMQATWAALHFAVGRAIGSASGGFLMEQLGPSSTYRIYALLCLVAAISYLLIYLRWLRAKELERRRHAKKLKAAKASGVDVSELALGGSITVDANGATIYAVHRKVDHGHEVRKGSADGPDGKESSLSSADEGGVDNKGMDKVE